MQELKMIGLLAEGNAPAVLCEISQELANELDIDHHGDVDALTLLKVLRKAYIKKAMAEKGDQPSASQGLSEEDRAHVHELIFNPDIAVQP